MKQYIFFKNPKNSVVFDPQETCMIQNGFESIDLPGTAALLITPNKPLLYPNPHI